MKMYLCCLERSPVEDKNYEVNALPSELELWPYFCSLVLKLGQQICNKLLMVLHDLCLHVKDNQGMSLEVSSHFYIIWTNVHISKMGLLGISHTIS